MFKLNMWQEARSHSDIVNLELVPNPGYMYHLRPHRQLTSGGLGSNAYS